METGFALLICEIARRIPYGRVATYGQLALLGGKPRAARAVGGIMSSRPSGSGIPCHRVIRADGRLAPGFSHEVPDLQRHLLRSEGIPFLPDGRVDLRSCQWDGR